MSKTFVVAALAGAMVSSAALAQNFVEVEANQDRAGADAQGAVNLSLTPDGVSTWGGVTGTSTSSSLTGTGLASIDVFRLNVPAMPVGIYRNRMTISTTGAAGHTGSIIGRTTTSAGVGQAATVNVGSTSSLQSSSTLTTPARMNQWYTFGAPTSLYYRVSGTATTTAEYTSTWSVEAVTPIAGPTLQPGSINLSTLGTTTIDTDMWVLDSNFNAIPLFGNDDVLSSSASQSNLTRTFAAGTYYLAISRFNLAVNEPSPGDDDFRTGSVTDFGGMLLSSSATATASTFDVNFTDSNGVAVPTSVTFSGAYDVQFIQFTVVPTPGAAALLGLGGLAMARRRR